MEECVNRECLGFKESVTNDEDQGQTIPTLTLLMSEIYRLGFYLWLSSVLD